MSDSNAVLPEMGFAMDFDEEERMQLGGFGDFLTLNEGDVLIEEGKPQNALFLVIMGSFHVQTDATGRPVLLGSMKAGDTVGEVNIFDPGIASASVVSRSIGEVWKIDRSSLEQFLEAHPRSAARFLVNVATQLSKRLRKTNEKVALAREAMLDSF
ncbi:MAG: cyclic nucleotide-binding domain-containing protein [Verrucomicrobiales bacterium]|nr:cyclic nucleotide-binding domain-containing protein [Verrucomicrobiales bacterium]